jgi:hypothetical protein
MKQRNKDNILKFIDLCDAFLNFFGTGAPIDNTSLKEIRRDIEEIEIEEEDFPEEDDSGFHIDIISAHDC